MSDTRIPIQYTAEEWDALSTEEQSDAFERNEANREALVAYIHGVGKWQVEYETEGDGLEETASMLMGERRDVEERVAAELVEGATNARMILDNLVAKTEFSSLEAYEDARGEGPETRFSAFQYDDAGWAARILGFTKRVVRREIKSGHHWEFSWSQNPGHRQPSGEWTLYDDSDREWQFESTKHDETLRDLIVGKIDPVEADAIEDALDSSCEDENGWITMRRAEVQKMLEGKTSYAHWSVSGWYVAQLNWLMILDTVYDEVITYCIRESERYVLGRGGAVGRAVARRAKGDPEVARSPAGVNRQVTMRGRADEPYGGEGEEVLETRRVTVRGTAPREEAAAEEAQSGRRMTIRRSPAHGDPAPLQASRRVTLRKT